MAKLTTDEKAARARARMVETSQQYSTGTYARKFVAPVFQKMIRAEFAAVNSGNAYAVVEGGIQRVRREVGQCTCITCGTVGPWKGNSIGGGVIETGHFLASRRNSILFEEDNVAPQCVLCNRHRGGEQQLFRKWMLAVRGPETIERLERLKTESRQFSRDELVDMKITYAARLRAAEDAMLF